MTALVLTLAVAMPVMADTEQEVKGATVVDDTASDSYKTNKPNPGDSVKSGTDTDEIFTLTYDSADLKIVNNAGGENNRPDANAWIGVKITAPEGVKGITKVEQDNSLGNASAIDENKLTKTFESDNKTLHEYFHVNVTELENAVEKGNEYLTYALKYTWDYNNQATATASNDETKVATTTVVVKIKVAGVTLVNDGTGTEQVLWDTAKYNAKKSEVEAAAKAEAEANKKPTAAKTNKEKDNTPGTGVENVYAVAGLVAVVTLAGAVVLNKRK